MDSGAGGADFCEEPSPCRMARIRMLGLACAP